MISKTKNVIFSLSMLLAGFSIFNCNAYDLLGLMNAGAPIIKAKYKAFVYSQAIASTMLSNLGAQINGCSGGGLIQANCICNSVASISNLNSYSGSKFNAWLSTSATDAICNIIGASGTGSGGCNGKSAPANAMYTDIHGNLLFNSWNDIKNGMKPAINLNTTETGNTYPIATPYVWTGSYDGGTVSGGTAATQTCSDWIATGTTGVVGDSSNISTWTNSNSPVPNPPACSGNNYSIYCFEQPQ